MCGILGGINNKEFNYPDGLKSILHRGPDYQGCEKIDNFVFCHSRLSILDLDERSHQPFSKGSHLLIFNGEIYNFLELKIILEEKGFKFETSSDTEVLYNWLIFKGIQGIEDLEGMFSFAWYDKKNQNLYLCRDSLGIKPLYIYREQDKLIFSSEIKAILKTCPEAKDIDDKLIAEYFLNGFIYEPHTGFKDIRKLEPGTYEKFDINGNLLLKQTYWSLESLNTKYQTISKDFMSGELSKSVKNHLHSDVPIGLFFSGGIDSSVILTQTKSIINPIVFKPKKSDLKNSGMSDDFYYAKKITNYLGVNFEQYQFDDFINSNETFLNMIKKVAINNEELMADFTFLNSAKLSEIAAKNNYKVILSGMGADEIFGGYPRYKLIKYKKLFRIFLPFSSILKYIPWFSKKIDRFKSFYKNNDFAMSYTSLIGYYTENEVSKLLGNNLGIEKFKHKMNNILSKVTSLSNLRKSMYLDFYGFLSHNFLVADKSSMMSSVEMRIPLATKILYEITWGLKDRVLLDIFSSKKPLRFFLKQYLPSKFFKRKKAGFNPPLDNYINNLGSNNVIITLEKNKIFQVIDKEFVKEILDAHYSNKSNNTYKIYQLLHFSFWYNEFK